MVIVKLTREQACYLEEEMRNLNDSDEDAFCDEKDKEARRETRDTMRFRSKINNALNVGIDAFDKSRKK
jgi:hypothetical protein